MIKEKIEYTNVVYNEASNKAQGLRPYVINEDGYLVALMIKLRKEFPKAVTVFYLTADEAEKIDTYMASGRDYVEKSRQKETLVMELLQSNIHRQIK